jgi:FYVE/RhoGEF/PH domain-containing protein 5/6
MESPHPKARHFEPTAAELFAQAARRRRPGKAGDQMSRRIDYGRVSKYTNADRRAELAEIVRGAARSFADRKLVREGPLAKISRGGPGAAQFWLFDDSLAYGKAARGGYDLSHDFTFAGPFVARAATRAEAPAHVARALTVRTGTKSFVAVAEDARERDAWLAAIAAAAGADMDAESDALAPVWVEDKNADACGLCDAKFTMFFRRHHCRKCGRLVCARCSDHKLPGTEDRACDDCAKAAE